MHRWLKRITIKRLLLSIALLLGISVAASAAVPGPHRALCPSCFGMVEIRDGIYADTDDTAVTASLLATLDTSVQNIDTYLDGWHGDPRILMCTREDGPCLTLFGNKGTRGISWGASLVRLNPKGLNETIMTHELLHVELATRMGRIGMWNNVIPKWFNEGLAVYVSGDDRFTYDYSSEQKIWTSKIVGLQDWRREVNADTWSVAYGASAQKVREIEDQIGREGIRDLIRRVTENGENFDVAASDALTIKPPLAD